MKTLVLVLALAACGGGSSNPPDIDAFVVPPLDSLGPPRETFTTSQSLEAGELVEALMPGGAPGDRAVIRLSAPASEIDWSIHAHPASGLVTVHEELDVMTVEYDFVPTEPADWFLLLKNSGPATMSIQVEVDLYGEMTFAFI
jgi:hypothetical protein